jgi:hypothetical protein
MAKNKKILLYALGFLAIAALGRAMVPKYNTYLANEPGLAYNKLYPLPLNQIGIDYLSFTTLVTSVTFANETFGDGSFSTGTFTVTSNTNLAGVAASSFLTVQSTQPAGSNATITVNGVPLINGIHWFQDLTSSATTADSIMTGILEYVPGVSVSTSSTVVYTTATQVGSFGNNMTLAVNFSTQIVSLAGGIASSVNFTGGRDQVNVSINGKNINYTPGAFSSNTAVSLVQAIQADPILNTLIKVSTNPSSTVVSATSTIASASSNYLLTSSSQSLITVGGTVFLTNGQSTGTMTGGKDSAYTLVNGSATVITVPSNLLTLGLPVLFSTATASIGGLLNGSTYYVIPVTNNAISLASSSANALIGLALPLTSSNSKVGANTYTMSALPITGVPSYAWQVSNDGQNWMNYALTTENVAISTVSFTSYNSTGTVNTYDFGAIDYSFLRLNTVAPTTGAIKIQAVGNGKNSTQ